MVKGTKVKLTGQDAWDGGGLDYALRFLSFGTVYTADRIDSGDYVSYIWLEEFPDKYFNYALFEEVI